MTIIRIGGASYPAVLSTQQVARIIGVHRTAVHSQVRDGRFCAPDAILSTDPAGFRFSAVRLAEALGLRYTVTDGEPRRKARRAAAGGRGA